MTRSGMGHLARQVTVPLPEWDMDAPGDVALDAGIVELVQGSPRPRGGDGAVRECESTAAVTSSTVITSALPTSAGGAAALRAWWHPRRRGCQGCRHP
jgi:hypothetical protein